MAESFCSSLVHDRLVVTGGGSGIGRGVALRLAGLGATAYIVGRREHALDETVEMADGLSGTLIPRACDLTDREAVDEMFAGIEAAEGGPVRALAHCAASVFYSPIRELTFDGFKDVIGTTLFTAFNALHRWGVALLDAELDGVAVALTSNIAPRGGPGVGHSSAGKAGIESFVQTAAREWGAGGVRVNVVGPGVFPVEKSKDLWERPSQVEQAQQRIALQRTGELREIVDPIVFMLSEAASYMTGSIVRVDGGLRLSPLGLPAHRFTTK